MMPTKEQQMDDLRTISKALFPDGLDVAKLTPQGRQELREAIDAVLRFVEPKFRTLMKD